MSRSKIFMLDSPKKRKNQNERNKYQRLRLQGVCIRCGHEPAAPDAACCPKCLEIRKMHVTRLRQSRKEREICYMCGMNKAETDKALCSECWEKEKIRKDGEYQLLKKNHICTQCKRRKSEPDMTICFKCSIKNIGKKHTPTEKQKNSHNIQKREKYHTRKAEGICVRCGKRKAFKEKTNCLECIIRVNRFQRNRKKYPNLRRNEYSSYGLCYMCSEPVMEGKKLCEKHYASVCQNLASARRSQSGKDHVWKNTNRKFFKYQK